MLHVFFMLSKFEMGSVLCLKAKELVLLPGFVTHRFYDLEYHTLGLWDSIYFIWELREMAKDFFPV